MMKFRVLDLFSGIGGFSLGLERTGGFETVAFCECDSYARRVLRKHWPDIPIFDDVRTLTGSKLQERGIDVDVVCGGFPCQDTSRAAVQGRGIGGERSGLWSEFLRLVCDLRPDWAIIENASDLRVRGADAVLASLEEAGYATWPLVVGAIHAGAPHRRQRVWILAYSDGHRMEVLEYDNQTAFQSGGPGSPGNPWQVESGVGRVVDGIPHWVDRLRCLGNAVVPQVVEAIGQAILQVEFRRENRIGRPTDSDRQCDCA